MAWSWLRFIGGLALGLLIHRGFMYLLARGAFTGNRYRTIEGRVQVKHPGEGWVYLDEHQADQAKLRDNK